MALINKLSAIGDAIREKTSTSELLTLDAMPDAIRSISGGGSAKGCTSVKLVDNNTSATIIDIQSSTPMEAIAYEGDTGTWQFSEIGDVVLDDTHKYKLTVVFESGTIELLSKVTWMSMPQSSDGMWQFTDAAAPFGFARVISMMGTKSLVFNCTIPQESETYEISIPGQYGAAGYAFLKLANDIGVDKITLKDNNALQGYQFAQMQEKNDTLRYPAIYGTQDTTVYFNNMFSNNYVVNGFQLPKLHYPYWVRSCSSMFDNCRYLKDIPEDLFDDVNTVWIDPNVSNGTTSQMFNNCYSLKTIPTRVLQCVSRNNPTSTNNIFFNKAFYNCYNLRNIEGLLLPTRTYTNNIFTNCFYSTSTLTHLTFATIGPNVQTVNFKNSVIDLTGSCGYATASTIYSYLSDAKEITDAASYERLKNDPDKWTKVLGYSNYNHDSMVETIRSLPDCTASGGTNNIVFKTGQGSLTDAGGPENLTEDEIAIASAKGWTVTIA